LIHFYKRLLIVHIDEIHCSGETYLTTLHNTFAIKIFI